MKDFRIMLESDVANLTNEELAELLGRTDVAKSLTLYLLEKEVSKRFQWYILKGELPLYDTSKQTYAKQAN